EQSGLRRNILSWNGRFNVSGKSVLKTTFLYSDLFYETPGALTKTEFENNPRSARPSGGGFPSAVDAKASIQQKTFLAGLNYRHSFSDEFFYTATAYGMFTQLKNPAIRNYGKNEDPNVGGRAVLSYTKSFFNLVAGAELQQGFSSVTVYKNKGGNADSLQNLDELRIRQSLVFLQSRFEKSGWELTLGGSLNFLNLSFQRNYPLPVPTLKRKFSNEFAPRVALSKNWKRVILYTSVAKGFSPPTTSELLPSGSEINLALSPEQGINYDVGFRGRIENFSFDVNAFLFSLQNTIVQRRDAGGGDYFINAGKTSQKGIETSLSYPFLHSVAFARQSLLWLSHTWHQFRYKEFSQLTQNFSGKRLPGISPHSIASGIDVAVKNGLFANLTYYYNDPVPLNDANSEYADAYHLIHAKLGFEKRVTDQVQVRLSAGAENLLNTKYSLGNDINAFGGRYYNVAPGRSYYVSLRIQLMAKAHRP
ncbi:MAG TPA: TonB-dependent receptor, partial [Flavisolibacter sp.]